MTIRAGDRVPPFSLPEAPGSEVRVEPVERPAVLLFFPLAFSGVCTSELCAVRDHWPAWGEIDLDVYAISVDSPFAAAKFRAELGLPFPVLSDFNREVAGMFGVLYEEWYGLKGVAKRAAFVVAPGGRVTYDWVTEDADVTPDFAAIRAAAAGAEVAR